MQDDGGPRVFERSQARAENPSSAGGVGGTFYTCEQSETRMGMERAGFPVDAEGEAARVRREAEAPGAAGALPTRA
jgi:hypothetical protein